MSVTKRFHFEAAHQLTGEQYGKCQNLHGHSYVLDVEVSGEIDKNGWVVDFGDLRGMVQQTIIDYLDHAYLNEIVKVPTAENVLLWIEKELQNVMRSGLELEKITLQETENCKATLYL